MMLRRSCKKLVSSLRLSLSKAIPRKLWCNRRAGVGPYRASIPRQCLFCDGRSCTVHRRGCPSAVESGLMECVVIAGGAASARPVRIGHRNDVETAVLAGLTEGESVILYPND